MCVCEKSKIEINDTLFLHENSPTLETKEMEKVEKNIVRTYGVDS